MKKLPRYCPRCGAGFRADQRYCAADGAHLLLTATRDSGVLFAGRYHVEDVLGRGGMGVVYRARQDKLERPVALKVLLARAEERAARRFLNEARTMSRLDNAHTATVYDFGETEHGELFLAMELLRGCTLRALLDERGPMALDVALGYVDAVAASLEEAHAQGIVHRDLKPENVFLAETPAAADFVKVLDFGIARLGDPAASRLTFSHEVLGTPLYLSPEAIAGEDVDARADVYALGLMFHELLTGAHPFAAETVFEVCRAHLEQDLPAVAGVRPEAAPPDAVQELIWASTAKDPRLRPVDAAAFRARLQAASSREGGAQHGATTSELAAHVSALTTVESGAPTEVLPPPSRVTAEHPERYVTAGDGAEIGRGGIGRVITVQDTHLDREIARKELLDERAASASAQQRFLREARITGQLEHPSIVPVYELGRASTGTCYYTMKLVRGRSLRHAIAGAERLEQRMGLLPHVVDVCQAIAYAHSRGVVHRDLKPANVMLGAFGETVVLDWGLARVIDATDGDDTATSTELVQDSGSLRTVDGSALGTPAYMSPEQARGETVRLDQRSDIWSLGMLLLEVLAGRTPWGDAPAHAVVAQIGQGRVPRMDELLAEAPPELAAIVSHALEGDPKDRYQSAGQLAADIEAFLTGGRVSTYTYSTGELLRRLVRRHRGLTAALAGLLVAIIAGAVGVTSEWRRAETARGEAVVQQKAAERAERLAHQHLADSYRALADKRLEERDHLAAAVFASASLLNDPRHEQSPWFVGDADAETVVRALSVLHAARAGTSVSFIRDLTPPARTMTLAPRARRIGLSTRELIQVLDLDSGAVLGSYRRPGNAFALSPDGRTVAEGGPFGALLSTIHGEILHRLGTERPKRRLSFSGDGHRLFTAGDDPPSVEAWDVATGRRLAAWTDFGGVFAAVAVSADGTFAITGTSDSRVHLLPLGDERPRQDVLIPNETIYVAALATDDTRVYLGAASGNLWEAAVDDLRDRNIISALPAEVYSVEVSPDGRWLALSHAGGAAVMPLTDRTSRFDFKPSVKGSYAAWLDDHHLVTQEFDAPVRLWSVRPAREVHMPSDGCDWTLVSLGGTTLLTGGEDGHLRWRDVASGRTIRALDLGVPIWQSALAPDQEAIALTRDDRQVDLRRLADGTLLKTFEVTEDNGLDVVFSPDGTRLAATTWNSVDLWDVRSGERLAHAKLGDGAAAAVDTLADGRSLAVSGTGGVRILAWRDLTEMASYERTNRKHFAASVSPDGRSIFTSGDAVDVLDLDTGTFSTRFDGHQGLAANLAWSPSKDTVATVGLDRTARVWQPATGAARLTVPLRGSGCALAYSRDGGALLIGATDDTVYLPLELGLWQADPAELLRQSEAAAGARLVGSELVPSYAD